MKITNRHVATIMISCLMAPIILSWGTFGHEHINRAAVLCLPQPLQQFFYNHIDFITQESTVPDLRKYSLNDKAEYPRHYVDLESFGAKDSLPATLDEVKAKYDEAFLSKNGILPWYINHMMEKLTKAFKEKRKTEILFLAGDLGHYIGDAHMPLHTTINHDGQLTDQKGIHAFWESQLPELFGESYNFKCQPAVYINDLRSETWNIIFSSHRLVDTLLMADRKAKENLSAGEIYKLDANGAVIKNKFNQPVHSVEYAKKFHSALNGMVESQLRKAIMATSNYWYTAWVNAGKPDLSDLDPAEVTERNKKLLKADLELFEKGKVTGIEAEKEF